MGYLKMVFDNYYESDDIEEKQKIRKEFSTRLWSSLPYAKSERTFKYRVADCKFDETTADIKEMFEEYSVIKYKVLKSRYNINEVSQEDLVKARINSNYAKYFDKEVYLHKGYYKHMAYIKNLYIYYITGQLDENVNIKEEVLNTYNKAMEYKQLSEERKYELSWAEYQELIEKCFDRIFENYIPVEEHPDINWEENDYWDWEEDNAVLRYINVSLNGYLVNYIKERNKPKAKYCEVCGVEIDVKSKNKYCVDCRKQVDREKARERMRRKRELAKQNKELQQK